jgi:hypothetical protein
VGEKKRKIKANSWGILVRKHPKEINKKIKEGI